jgi:hypothetical protein
MRIFEKYVPESIHGRGSFGILLAGRRSSGTRAGSAVVTAADQVTTGTEVLAAAVGARAEKTGRSEGHGLVGVAGGAETAEIVATDLAGGVVGRRSLITISKSAGVTATHGHAATASAVVGLALALGLGGLSSTGSLLQSENLRE